MSLGREHWWPLASWWRELPSIWLEKSSGLKGSSLQCHPNGWLWLPSGRECSSLWGEVSSIRRECSSLWREGSSIRRECPSIRRKCPPIKCPLEYPSPSNPLRHFSINQLNRYDSSHLLVVLILNNPDTIHFFDHLLGVLESFVLHYGNSFRLSLYIT